MRPLNKKRTDKYFAELIENISPNLIEAGKLFDIAYIVKDA